MDKKTFELEKDLLKERYNNDINMHKLRMEELMYIRETEKLKHQWQLEAQRIRSAEIRKANERRFMEQTRVR